MTDIMPEPGGTWSGFAVTPALEAVSGQLAQAASDFRALLHGFTGTRPSDKDFGEPDLAQSWAALGPTLEQEILVTALAVQEAADLTAAALAGYGRAEAASASLSTGIGQALAGPTP